MMRLYVDVLRYVVAKNNTDWRYNFNLGGCAALCVGFRGSQKAVPFDASNGNGVVGESVIMIEPQKGSGVQARFAAPSGPVIYMMGTYD